MYVVVAGAPCWVDPLPRLGLFVMPGLPAWARLVHLFAFYRIFM